MELRNILIGSSLVIAAAITAALLIGPQSARTASDSTVPRMISVSGEGQAKAKPDMASITTGVTSDALTAKEALSKNNAAMASVLATLKAAGISEDDIQTSDFSVQPQYAQFQPGQTGSPRISAYQVSNQVTAKVKQLDKLGTVLDALVRAGSNQISGVAFDIDNPAAMLEEARKKAVADAKAKAELYASAAGVSLGAVLQISESSSVIPQPVSFRAMKAMAAESSVPIAAGQNTIIANVSISYEIR